MSSRLMAVAFDVRDPVGVADFWAELLGREVVADARGLLLPGSTTQVGLRFIPSRAEKAGLNRMHLHLTSESVDAQQRTVATALALGAEHLDVGQLPEEGHVVLADPGGNELCVIEAGNSFLAGCGFLGEVACDGTRDVGLFWAEALGWPLVWDEGEQTAVQSPLGGTKVAWGGPPVARKRGRNRQRFDLVTEDGLAAEVERVMALGATERPVHEPGTVEPGVVELTDPDGNEFSLAEGASS